MKFAALVLIAFVAAAWAAPTDLVHFVVPPTPFNQIGGRIISGSPATLGQFPHQTSLLISVPDGTALCGGSLISTLWILTAAHCIVDARGVEVHLGTLTYNGGTIIPASSALVHGSYVTVGGGSDVSVVQLSAPVSLSSTIGLVSLATTAISEGVSVTVSGWGRTSDSSTSVSSFLNYVDLTTITNAVCGNTYGFVQEGIVCSSGQGSRSTCEGDSGGPLITGSGNSTVQVGIVSFGHVDGCSLGFPVGFTRVASFRSWISTNTGV